MAKEDAGGHATPKPIALCSRAIKSSSRLDLIKIGINYTQKKYGIMLNK